ncbi:LPXTG cell wall anchor domain-containing protein [Glycomyces xiaoerkulensis]|uniref:LPXTG cell wall anchor domain-containing protein n=1 Tax=Glycomyces xiaoerkulensis TaxID=2038139 RepID=UPI000C263C6A|nr:LPXTG cell wall anchor domain-containing protein [Glycomyces xiaoerkulensis]
MTSPKPRRFGARLGVTVAASTLAAGAIALPASAQSVDDPDVNFQFESLITPGGERSSGVIEVDFGPDFSSDTHTVSANLAIHAAGDSFEFDLSGAVQDCNKGSLGTQITCTRPDADSYTFFGFDYWANDLAVPGVYDYTLTVSLDSDEVESKEGHIEVADGLDPEPHNAFRHSDIEVTGVSPGDQVEVSPRFLQEDALAESAAAIVVTFGEPFARIGKELDGAEAIAGYDNCVDGIGLSDRGVTCVITDFEDLPGTLFTFSGPMTYAIDEAAPGPQGICQCYYSVSTVNEATLETELGGEFWDDSSANLLGLVTTDSWDGPTDELDAPYSGTVTIVTAEHPFDLALDDADVEGEAGDQRTITVPVVNNGSADAYDRLDFYGTYAIRGQLPAGLELIGLDSEDDQHWACLDSDSLGHDYGNQEERTELDRFDFACYFKKLDAGDTLDFTFTVEITDATSSADGLIEVREAYTPEYTDTLDADLDDNVAVIGVNAGDLIDDGDDDASGKLPATGTPMTILISAAAAVLAAGAVMFVVMRRRKAATDW